MSDKSVSNFWDLKVWQMGNSLALVIYKITKNFPIEEKFGIISQLQRASVSVTSNIAEGFGRFHYKDKIRFYYHSRGSISEIQSLLFLCKSLAYIDEGAFQNLFTKYNDVKKLINGLINSLLSRNS